MEPSGDLVAGSGHMLGGTVALGHCRGGTTAFSMHYVLSCVGARCSDVGRPKFCSMSGGTINVLGYWRPSEPVSSEESHQLQAAARSNMGEIKGLDGRT